MNKIFEWAMEHPNFVITISGYTGLSEGITVLLQDKETGWIVKHAFTDAELEWSTVSSDYILGMLKDELMNRTHKQTMFMEEENG